MKPWYVYILHCADHSLYTGITTDLKRRVEEHNGNTGTLGAKYTRSRRPVKLVYQEECSSRAEAAAREHKIKCLNRLDKLELIKTPVIKI
ncbi:MAG: GIY-YIG nuclease family protein [Gammaproteobacteria bacterium]|nr:GIY-YIG nuclease family protein [Gammaproteobacteria bacterium]